MDFRFMEEYKERHENDEEQYEYDEDGNIIWTWKKVSFLLFFLIKN